ncbi:hypothetical protein DICA3_F18602 [Diutina catenulata]
MDKPIDEIQSLSNLVHQVQQQVAESQDNLSKLEELTHGLHEGGLDPPNGHVSPPSPTEPTTQDVITQLQAQRLELVMRVQEQDYYSDKLREVVDQNRDVVETVKEYFHSRDQITAEERDYARRRLEFYRDAVISPTTEQLRRVNVGMRHDLATVRRVVTKVGTQFCGTMTRMDGSYQEEVNQLIRDMNTIFKSIEQQEPELPPIQQTPQVRTRSKRDSIMLPLDRPMSMSSIPSPTISLGSDGSWPSAATNSPTFSLERTLSPEDVIHNDIEVDLVELAEP